MAFRVPNINPSHIQKLREALDIGAGLAYRTITSDVTGQTIKQAGRGALGIFKKVSAKHGKTRGLRHAVKAFGENLAGGLVKAATGKPKLNLDEKFAEATAAFKFKHGRNPKSWSPYIKRLHKEKGLHDIKHFEKVGGVAGADWAFSPLKIERRSRIAGRIAKGFLGLGAVGYIAGHATDKVKGEGYFEGPRGGRFETQNYVTSIDNPEGHGSRVDLGLRYRSPGGSMAELGGNLGYGHSQKAGWAHQGGARLKVHTPVFKTGWEIGEQHAFGTKARSRRVAAIRRAVFGREEHLGVFAQVGKKKKRGPKLDTL